MSILFTALKPMKHTKLVLARNRLMHTLILMISCVLHLNLVLKLFTQVAILTRGGPDGATTTLVLYLFREGYQAQRIGQGSAVAVLFFLGVTVLALGLGRALRDGLR